MINKVQNEVFGSFRASFAALYLYPWITKNKYVGDIDWGIEINDIETNDTTKIMKFQKIIYLWALQVNSP